MTKRSSCKTVCFLWALLGAAAIGSSAQTFTTVAYFTDGSSTYSSLIEGRDGNLYGTSENGGTNGNGTVFRVTPTGTLTTLYTFCSQANCADGFVPVGALALGIDGNFYGTAQSGGASGLGTVFKITPSGAYTVLHNFGGDDGSEPDAGLVLASDGNFYGTTFAGGVSGGGTVFKLSPSGALTTLHSFDGTDGDFPIAQVLQGNDGNLYGTTEYGGTSSTCSFGCGTVFKITLGGRFTSLHSFSFTDGNKPHGGVVQASTGGFYGTTFEGGDASSHGCTNGCGTIFKFSSAGAFAIVHKFHSGDGGNPVAGLLQATDGNLYGESQLSGAGEIFKLSLPRTVTTEYNFTAASGGGGNTALVQNTNGTFYGSYGIPGAIFSFDVGLGPFVSFVISTGKVGKTVQILGQGLTGATSVTFNSAPATSFTVVSDTYMTAVVPSGASTGSVVVTTPTGTLTSNVNFRISK